MSDLTQDFNEEFLEKFTGEDLENIDAIIESILSDEESKNINSWVSSFEKEKHDALNFTYHVSITNTDIEDEDFEITLTFYTGIDVGCELVDYSFDGSSELHKTRFESVLSDITLDEDAVIRNSNWDDKKRLLNLANQMFEHHKDEILDIYKKQNYDNYVTGGGTSKTNSHYQEQFDKFHKKGLYWNLVYEEVEVDRNIV